MPTKPTTKIAITMTYADWLDVLRALNYALGDMKDQDKMRKSERALLLAECREAKQELLTKLSQRIAK